MSIRVNGSLWLKCRRAGRWLEGSINAKSLSMKTVLE